MVNRSTSRRTRDRYLQFAYELAFVVASFLLVLVQVAWPALALFLLLNAAALRLFSNRIWKSERYMSQPFNSTIGAVLHITVFLFPVLLQMDAQARTRAVAALAAAVVVRALMLPRPRAAGDRRRWLGRTAYLDEE